MNDKARPNYDAFTDLLEHHNMVVTTAEVHGVICGLICGGMAQNDARWQQHFNALLNDDFELPSEVKKAVNLLFSRVYEELLSQTQFELLMPHDDDPLDDRLEAMMEWSAAFLAGFGVVQQDLYKASEELQEIIQDISSITQVSADFDQEDEESETAFVVLYEHLKLGATLAFEEFGKGQTQPPRPTLH
ncbi:UPF0149 family protein [Oceanisphaera pacifica]|uniref:UPF0149 family protein n=1 Tax=Oceanisphaera pacifica TaxID=2818389 RepID=A0ABS3NE32_9GAMM|nr:UPF0149 family protein [Oceanisphaera pacifica]MBO1518841.1 UPF0149 family protein [Oceanisphaera pacifica]